jgi:hypothetical protein
MLSNIELEDMAEKDGLDLIGVYSKNKIPTERRVGSYIINMQDFEDGNGTHWIAFKIFDNGKACYFDSFGTIYPEDVGEFLKIFKPIAWNNRQIQYPKSEMCGWFCLAFIKYFNDCFSSPSNKIIKYNQHFSFIISCFFISFKPRENI